uniref:Ubiquitin carboxyl-terminal hydrolase 25 n=1 Tax=Nothobranchius pienaari TaxID=704102 RepID=A0A1A8MBF6_9TELE
MTVEQNVLQQHSQKHQQTLLNQLKEVTGTTDIQLLQQALQVSNGDLAEAVAFLTEKNAKAPQQDETTYYQTSQVASDRYISVGSQADTNVIDLTGDDKDDLQRAIALSLEESSRAFRETGITDEEQAISRVLEASIAENKASLKRTHTEVWSDSPNPHDRKRIDGCPVGLKNVGNTCWFSAVIQSLFHLLEFQRLVLNYSPPARVLDLPRNQKEHRNLPFMQELRNLFSLMVGSKRKYVDPSRAVEILKDAFKSSESQQQDVSEFTHKLLDWLEDAFQMKAEEDSVGEKPKNPMVELFYGRFLAVGILEGKKFENTEMFGQYPLQVNGFKDLHECLEAAMIEGEIESLHSAENSARSGQEHWFTELPPVLTFELSRFEFNQALGRPEKIHSKLEFSSVLYMDRYMDRNREITRIKREEIRRLKEHLTLLQQRLERYLSYGSGPKRFPLADVLQYAMEFASSKPVCTSPVEDIDTSAPPGGTTGQQLPSSSTAEQDALPPAESSGPTSAPSTAPSVAQQQRVPVHKPFTHSRLRPDLPMHPAPRHITEEELRVLEGCLHRWRSEVENDTCDLQGSISRIHRSIDLMYSDKSMMQVPYRLHAVLVHEGQASAGHYWAYIYDHANQRWMKYNDVSITESSWEELERDSFGGMTNASAYCLMYIDDRLPHLITEDTDDETGQVLRNMDSLPPVLRRFVQEDNRWFQQELSEWEGQFCQTATPQEESTSSAESPNSSLQQKPVEPAPQSGPSAEEPNQGAPSETQSVPEVEKRTDDDAGETAEAEDPESLLAPESPGSQSVSTNTPAVSDTLEPSQNSNSAELQSQTPVQSPEPSIQAPAEHHVQKEVAGLRSEVNHEASREAPELGLEHGDEEQQQEVPTRQRQAENEVSEVEIPNVGRIMVRADADGYNEEMMLTPAMQGVILAIAKARQTFDSEGPEAGLIKAFHEEYSRLYELSKEEITPLEDARLQHALVYFFQNKAPKRVIERTLLEQFTDRNLSFDERAISIMREARAKLRLIKPEDMDMDEYLQWHDDYRLFRTVFVHLLTGLEHYQHGKMREALNYLAHAYETNASLLLKGDKRGVDNSLIAVYRRKCLTVLNESVSRLFCSGEEGKVEDGVAIMDEAVIPCLHLMSQDMGLSQEDRDTMENIRSHWCCCLSQDMDVALQAKLAELLPRVLDGSTDAVVLKDPPKVQVNQAHDLCSRLAAVMESIHNAAVVTVK